MCIHGLEVSNLLHNVRMPFATDSNVCDAHRGACDIYGLGPNHKLGSSLVVVRTRHKCAITWQSLRHPV